MDTDDGISRRCRRNVRANVRVYWVHVIKVKLHRADVELTVMLSTPRTTWRLTDCWAYIHTYIRTLYRLQLRLTIMTTTSY